jgi:hypothetical protein
LDEATAAGYGEFRHAQGIACIAQPGVSTMGIHYVKGDLVGDAPVDPSQPEAPSTPRPNRYGLPPFYALHAWIWQPNPSGKFEPWNPRVSCTSS